MRAFKFRIYPTLKQRKQLQKEFAASRFVWNWSLDQKDSMFKLYGFKHNVVTLSRDLTCLKKHESWLLKASVTVMTNTLYDLDEAYKKFFRHEAEHPKFKKFKNSVCYQMDKRQGTHIFQSGKLLKLSKLGPIDVKWSDEVPVFPNSATISKRPNGDWYVSLQVDCTKPMKLKSHNKIGLDLGIQSFITTSDGDKIAPPIPYKLSKRKLKILQRRFNKTKKKNSNRAKARIKVANLHQKISDQRKDFLHKLSTTIVSENQVIAIEDLKVSSLAQGKLASAVTDCGWGMFTIFLTHKALWNGRELLKHPRYERSTGVCPNCNYVTEKLPLNIRSWKCPCGLTHDRDIAAAQVILKHTVQNTVILNTARSAGSLITKACGPAKPLDDREAIPENRGRVETGKSLLRPKTRRFSRPLKSAALV